MPATLLRIAETYADGAAERVMGAILRKSKWPRDTFLVSSKVFFGAEREGPNQTGLSRKHVMEACDAALRRLQVDYLDLYYCHRPDLDTPIEELDLPMRAYNALKRAGIVKVGQLLTRLDGGEAELLKLRNFGQKSLMEVREKLVERGFDVPESTLPLDGSFDDDEDDDDAEAKA